MSKDYKRPSKRLQTETQLQDYIFILNSMLILNKQKKGRAVAKSALGIFSFRRQHRSDRNI